MFASDFLVPSGQAASPSKQADPDNDNLPDILYQSLHTNVTPCRTHDLDDQQFVNNDSSHFIIHLNISSLRAHFDELKEFLSNFSSPPSIIFISETRINVEPLFNVNLPGYTFLHIPSNTRAGGVGAYFLNNLNIVNKDGFGLNVQGCENLWFDVKFPGQKQKYTFAVIYRHPHNNTSEFTSALDETLNILDKTKSNKVYILGDMNLDLNPNNLSISALEYLSTLQSHAFFSVITEPTRVTATSKTCIDHILTNDSRSLIKPGVFSYKISDHYPIFLTITNLNRNKTNAKDNYSYRNINSINGVNFRTDLEIALNPILVDINKSTVTHQKIDECFSRLVKSISDVIDIHAPIIIASRKQRRLQQNPWLTKGLLISIKNKQKLFKTCFLQGNDFQKNFYKKYANKLTRIKALSKKMYYIEAFSQRKNNPRELWKLIKSVIPSKKTPHQPRKLLIENRVIEDPTEIAQHFNNYFSEIGKKIAQNSTDNTTNDTTFKKYLKKFVIHTIMLDPPQPIEIYNTINSLNLHKAYGYDNIPSYFLRLSNEVLAPILSLLFLHVFELGYFPQIFKTAKVIPIFKNGNI